MKYHLITYGCQMNVADTQEMAQPLKDQGLVATPTLKDADLVLMNTCTVREQAEHRADSNLGRLRVWKEADPHRILIVAGCAASRWGDSIRKKYPYIDLVAPATRIEEFPAMIDQVLRERWDYQGETRTMFRDKIATRDSGALAPSRDTDFPNRPFTGSERSLFGDSTTAFVTIMRGCNLSCSYCIVPQVRGREVYRPMPDILDEIRRKTTEGLTEVMLLGQTVNSYYWRETGKRGNEEMEKTDFSPVHRFSGSPVHDFADLLRAVNAIESVKRIRFMSPHPRHMKDRVIEAMAECVTVCRHIHLPLQSGSDRLLESMKRLYTQTEYATIVEHLRRSIPDIMITTDVIVGYPGETEEDFQATLQVMKTLRFDGLFAFKFSPRPGTVAAGILDDVPGPLKEERLKRVLSLNKEIQFSTTPHVYLAT